MKNPIAALIMAACMAGFAPSSAVACVYSGGTYEGLFQGKTMVFVFDKACENVGASFQGQPSENAPATLRGKRVVIKTEQLVITFSGNGKRLSIQAPGGGFLSAKLKRVK